MSCQGYGRRIEQALLQYQSGVVGSGKPRPTYTEIGAAIAKAEGRRKPYVSHTLTGWIQERNEPTLKAFDAMAKVFGHLNGAWLAFNCEGGLSLAADWQPNPSDLVPVPDPVKVTPKRKTDSGKRRRANGA